MKKGKCDSLVSLTRRRVFQILVCLGVFYVITVITEIPFVFNYGFSSLAEEEDITLNNDDGYRLGDPLSRHKLLESGRDTQNQNAPFRPVENSGVSSPSSEINLQERLSPQSDIKIVSSLDFDAISRNSSSREKGGLYKTAKVASDVGRKLWEDIELGRIEVGDEKRVNKNESCPHWVSLTGSDFVDSGRLMMIPCGLTLGSHITVVGKPRAAHPEENPKIAVVKNDEQLMVSQFMMELQGLNAVDGEDPPRILHFNPRLRGDWSGKPVIEQNTCYRMQWGSSLRCEGWKSKANEETVDGQVKCEKWFRDDDDGSGESNAIWFLNRLIGRTKKITVDWPFPFVEEKLFVLTLTAGLEGFHVNVDGRHVTSFPYRTGFGLDDATGLSLNGDIEIHSVFAASLPTSHPNSATQGHLEMSNAWKAPPLPKGPIELFTGILSAGNHFAERMAVRKSWMQHRLVKSSNVVARFFVALHTRKEVNVELKKEAEYFGDIVIVPYMDNYDLVVLKTVAICEYGARTLSARYIMKCDDDTFVRVDAVIEETKKVRNSKSLYIGNINYYHKPMRQGKWAVTYKEWPEEDYPPYANGPGYILSSDIAHNIISEYEKHKLRLFKMEDVSMGMWVEQFNSSKPVEYVHSLKFCQYGCIEGYYTAHYQSPRQMICLWKKLQESGKPQCCNMR